MRDPQLPVLDATGRRWWRRRRRVHVPVVVWIAASVVAGAGIGAALEPGG